MISNHKKIDAIFDSRSQSNLISEDLVKEVNLEIVVHHKKYLFGWIDNNANLSVTSNCLFKLTLLKSSLMRLS